MFGKFNEMMGQFKETQKKVEDTKARLDSVYIDEISSDGLLHIVLSANRKIKSIRMDDALLQDKEQLEDYLILTLNNAIAKATNVQETELAAVAKQGLTDIPGFDLFK